MVDPDSFTVYREYNDNGVKIIEKQKGRKAHFIHMSSESGMFLFCFCKNKNKYL